MSDIVDLNAERNKRSQPDSAHIRKDDFGRPLYEYLLSYEMGGSSWSTTVWAYSQEDAESRVSAMRDTLAYKGQLFEVIPG